MFRQAENYPVDLYFLMDGSNTMRAHKDTLANITERLGNMRGYFDPDITYVLIVLAR